MANFNDQVLKIWDEWEQTTGESANNPDDFILWAMENKKLLPRPQDVAKMLRRQVTGALRQAMRVDEDGVSYRAKQCATILEEGTQVRLWFDTDTGGTSNLRQKAVRQRRDAIANDVYRAVCDVDHMNMVFSEETQLVFPTDFTEDSAERRAADLLNRDDNDGKEAA